MEETNLVDAPNFIFVAVRNNQGKTFKRHSNSIYIMHNIETYPQAYSLYSPANPTCTKIKRIIDTLKKKKIVRLHCYPVHQTID